MKMNKDVMRYLKEEAKNISIPESIAPEQMRKRLEQKEGEIMQREERSTAIEKDKEKEETGKRWKRYSVYKCTTAAACVLLLIGAVMTQKTNLWDNNNKTDLVTELTTAETSQPTDNGAEEKKESVEVTEASDLLVAIEYPEITYEDIYESMFGNLEEMKYQNSYRGEVVEGTIMEDAVLADGMEGAVPEAPADDTGTNIVFKGSEETKTSAAGVLSENAVMDMAEAEESVEEYGTTNVQTEGVEEADVVKNDGRYLYHKIYQEKDNIYTQAIQIVDTKDGLKEVVRIEGFDEIQEFYVWEDTLVTIENKYLEMIQADVYEEEVMMYVDYGNYNRQFHEITFYNIQDRSKPDKIKTFTLKGRYDSSRIADGYFYGFSKFYANPGEGKTDYASYIPQVDGVQLKAEQILLQEENQGNCYLVLTSIDMKNPTQFTDSTAIVTDGDMYYVSSNNIYIADSLPMEPTAGKQTNKVSLLRFSYEKGSFKLQAEGTVPGSLESSFSMDEYEGNLRMVTTVDEYQFEEITDDLTGEVLGNYLTNEIRSNALYVLDSELKILGKIENLAKDERIYSARFMGETGYFVTFRQTDPLFAVDLKDPKNPKILSELKISGFSEYLHFYGEDRLLGIGMEADEETGRTEGMKLSMFDISNPSEVTEVAKLRLDSYEYSQALYNHRAVMISTSANIFGFEVEGYENDNYKLDYLVFSYEDDKFVQKLKVEAKNNYGRGIRSGRGTFIGEVFYLLTRDGSVKSYDLNTGELLEEI